MRPRGKKKGASRPRSKNSTAQQLAPHQQSTEPVAVFVSPFQEICQPHPVYKILDKAGEGKETPKEGDRVYIHYTTKLLSCGTLIESSPEEYGFTLGKGINKALDVAVANMKKGEKCTFCCNSDFAFGNGKPRPENIPENTQLSFNVELIKWREDLTVGKDGGVLRSVIQEGKGHLTPSHGDFVEVHLVGYYAGEVFTDNDEKYFIGYETGYIAAIPGLSIALTKFKKGEKSRIYLSSEYGYGAKRSPCGKIPPDSPLEFEVTLRSFKKMKESCNMTTKEKLEFSELFKEVGAEYVKKEDYDLALRVYEKIIDYLKLESEFEGKKKRKRNELLQDGYLNLSHCHLQLGKYEEVIENCDKALELDGKSCKALYRKGRAYLALKEYEAAKKCFKEQLKLEKNRITKQYLNICNHEIAKEKQLYQTWQQKMADGNKLETDIPTSHPPANDLEQSSKEALTSGSHGMEIDVPITPPPADEQSNEEALSTGSPLMENDISPSLPPFVDFREDNDEFLSVGSSSTVSDEELCFSGRSSPEVVVSPPTTPVVGEPLMYNLIEEMENLLLGVIDDHDDSENGDEAADENVNDKDVNNMLLNFIHNVAEGLENDDEIHENVGDVKDILLNVIDDVVVNLENVDKKENGNDKYKCVKKSYGKNDANKDDIIMFDTEDDEVINEITILDDNKDDHISDETDDESFLLDDYEYEGGETDYESNDSEDDEEGDETDDQNAEILILDDQEGDETDDENGCYKEMKANFDKVVAVENADDSENIADLENVDQKQNAFNRFDNHGDVQDMLLDLVDNIVKNFENVNKKENENDENKDVKGMLLDVIDDVVNNFENLDKKENENDENKGVEKKDENDHEVVMLDPDDHEVTNEIMMLDDHKGEKTDEKNDTKKGDHISNETGDENLLLDDHKGGETDDENDDNKDDHISDETDDENLSLDDHKGDETDDENDTNEDDHISDETDDENLSLDDHKSDETDDENDTNEDDQEEDDKNDDDILILDDQESDKTEKENDDYKEIEKKFSKVVAVDSADDSENFRGKQIALRRFDNHGVPIFCCAFDHTGKYLVTGGEDGSAFVWNLHSAAVKFKCTGLYRNIIAASFSPDSKYVVIADNRGILRFWEVIHAVEVWYFEIIETQWLQWCNKKNAIVVGDENGCCFKWTIPDMDVPKKLKDRDMNRKCFPSPHNPVLSCCAGAISYDDEQLITGYVDGTLKLWTNSVGVPADIYKTPLAILPGSSPHKAITMLKFNKKGTVIIVGSKDGTAKVVKASNLQVIWTLDGCDLSQHRHSNVAVEHVGFCHFLPYIVIGTSCGVLSFYDISTKRKHFHSEFKSSIVKMICDEEEPFVYVAFKDGTVHAYDVRTGKRETCWNAHTTPIRDIALSRDHKYFLTASQDICKVFET